MSERQAVKSSTSITGNSDSGVLQRKCTCGNHTIAVGECEACKKNQTLQHSSLLRHGRATNDKSRVSPEDHETPISSISFVEPSLGYEFSQVPLYADSHSGQDSLREFGQAPIRAQAKLKVSQPGDPLEEEADRVAEYVISRERSGSSVAVTSCEYAERVQRQLEEELDESLEDGPVVEEDGEEFAEEGGGESTAMLKRNRSGLRLASLRLIPSGFGIPLDRGVRARMEQRFGHDFGRVRVHLDEEAADSARQLGAEAYTVGAHIYFGAKRFNPGTRQGDKLLAHELTHVLQQTSGGRRLDNGFVGVQRQPKGKRTGPAPQATQKKEPPVIVVDVGGGQKAVVKSEGKVVRTMPISSGKKGHRTDTGTFRITERDRDHTSTKYGKCVAKDGTETTSDKGVAGCPKGSKYKGAPMPYFLRFNGLEGFHQGHVPQHPDSHGCVRLGESNAKWLWEWTKKNSAVRVIVCKDAECPGAKKKPKTTPKGK